MARTIINSRDTGLAVRFFIFTKFHALCSIYHFYIAIDKPIEMRYSYMTEKLRIAGNLK